MMIEPPIDKLLEITGCKYALVCLISKRARYLLDRKPEMLAEMDARAVTAAAREVYTGAIAVGNEH
ncbi:MAG: DNA-directed RNA polymerase subunit omega [Firmicutes bacterium]|nr:DNA-directed RNA polymerase subunit omega [Bacillota bacterium]